MKDHSRIKGLTTAASLWIVACIGLSVASEEYMVSIFGTLIVMIILKGLHKIEFKNSNYKFNSSLRIVVDKNRGNFTTLLDILISNNVSIETFHLENQSYEIYELEALVSYKDNNNLINAIGNITELNGVKEAVIVK